MTEQQPNWWRVKNADKPASQMIKREMIAAMAMQGIITKGDWESEVNIACRAVECADALLAELEKTK
jgi:hypothetical protein